MNEIQMLFVVFSCLFISLINSLKVYDKCTEHYQCPSKSSCLAYDCHGYSCLCDEGYVATEDKTRCLEARLVGEACSYDQTICMSPFAFCIGHCECMGVFQMTSDGRCKLPGMGYTGDDCDELSPCHPPAACRNNKCVCERPYRHLTRKEFWIDPMHPRQCVEEWYSVGKCNGTSIDIPPSLVPPTSGQMDSEFTSSSAAPTTSAKEVTDTSTKPSEPSIATEATTEANTTTATTTTETTTTTITTQAPTTERTTKALTTTSQKTPTTTSSKEAPTTTSATKGPTTTSTTKAPTTTSTTEASLTTSTTEAPTTTSTTNVPTTLTTKAPITTSTTEAQTTTITEAQTTTSTTTLPPSTTEALKTTLASKEPTTKEFQKFADLDENDHSVSNDTIGQFIQKKNISENSADTSKKPVQTYMNGDFSSSMSPMFSSNPSTTTTSNDDGLGTITNTPVEQSDLLKPRVPILHVFSQHGNSEIVINKKETLESTDKQLSKSSNVVQTSQMQDNINPFVHASNTVQETENLDDQPKPSINPPFFFQRMPIVPITVTLFDVGRDLFSSCTKHSQCTEHAICKPNSCEGYLCLCRDGYIASDDKKYCLRAIRNGERCDPRTDKCLSDFSICSGVCKCLEFFQHTKDGRCKLPDVGYVGDNCKNRGCQYPSKCVNGSCRCEAPFRELTTEEFWVSPQSTLQCRLQDYSLHKCNGSLIHVPEEIRPNKTLLNEEIGHSTGIGLSDLLFDSSLHLADEHINIIPITTPIFKHTPVLLPSVNIHKLISISPSQSSSDFSESINLNSTPVKGYNAISLLNTYLSKISKSGKSSIFANKTVYSKMNNQIPHNISQSPLNSITSNSYFYNNFDLNSNYLSSLISQDLPQQRTRNIDENLMSVSPPLIYKQQQRERESEIKLSLDSLQSSFISPVVQYTVDSSNKLPYVTTTPEHDWIDHSQFVVYSSTYMKENLSLKTLYNHQISTTSSEGYKEISEFPESETKTFETISTSRNADQDIHVLSTGTDFYHYSIMEKYFTNSVNSAKSEIMPSSSSQYHIDELNSNWKMQSNYLSQRFKSFTFMDTPVINDGTHAWMSSSLDQLNSSRMILDQLETTNHRQLQVEGFDLNIISSGISTTNSYENNLDIRNQISSKVGNKDYSIYTRSPNQIITNGVISNEDILQLRSLMTPIIDNSGNSHSFRDHSTLTILIEEHMGSIVAFNSVNSDVTSYTQYVDVAKIEPTLLSSMTSGKTSHQNDMFSTMVIRTHNSSQNNLEERYRNINVSDMLAGIDAKIKITQTEKFLGTASKTHLNDLSSFISTDVFDNHSEVFSSNVLLSPSLYMTNSNELLEMLRSKTTTSILQNYTFLIPSKNDKSGYFDSVIKNIHQTESPLGYNSLESLSIRNIHQTESPWRHNSLETLSTISIFLHPSSSENVYDKPESSANHDNAISERKNPSDVSKVVRKLENPTLSNTDNIDITDHHTYSAEISDLLLASTSDYISGKYKLFQNGGTADPYESDLRKNTKHESILIPTNTPMQIHSSENVVIFSEGQLFPSYSKHDYGLFQNGGTTDPYESNLRKNTKYESILTPTNTPMQIHSSENGVMFSEGQLFPSYSKRDYVSTSDSKDYEYTQENVLNVSFLNISLTEKSSSTGYNKQIEPTKNGAFQNTLYNSPAVPLSSSVGTSVSKQDHIATQNTRTRNTYVTPKPRSVYNKTDEFFSTPRYTNTRAKSGRVPVNADTEDLSSRLVVLFGSTPGTDHPNNIPNLPELDYPAEKPHKTEEGGGFDKLILPVSIVGVFLVNVIAAIIVLLCRRKKRRSDLARNLAEAKKRKIAEERAKKTRFKIPRPNVYPSHTTNVIDNTSSDSSTYYNYINTGFSSFQEDDPYETIDKKVLKGSL